jgi:hypothetical protein
MQVEPVIREGIIRIEQAAERFEFLAAEVPEARAKFKRIVRFLNTAARQAEVAERWCSLRRRKVS